MWSSVVAAALVGLLTTSEAARTHVHSHTHRRHNRSDVEKRHGQCQFPSDAGLVAVTPGAQNAGWAMSPDQPCKPGNWCPYACPPGQVSMQWNPKATSYTYPISMDGGLYCDEHGNIKKPFPDKDYCVDGTGTVIAVNKAGKPLSFCQTVLPGDESMLIPTLVTDTATLAVPDTSYWCETAAHYYINAPGVGTEGCMWGTSANPIGNWAYYVAGANTDAHGNTFVKIGHNPVVQEPATPFRNTPPSFGVEITCEDGAGCNGLPCKIDPSSGLNGVTSFESADGAGGASFCVVTVPKGQKANIVVFEAGGSGAGDSTPSSSPTSVSSSSPTSTSTSTSTAATTTASPSTTSLSSTSPFSSTATLSDASNHRGSPTPKSTPISYSYAPHVFAETSASADGSAAATPTSGATTSASASAKSSSAASPISTGSMTGLALCLMAGIMMQF